MEASPGIYIGSMGLTGILDICLEHVDDVKKVDSDGEEERNEDDGEKWNADGKEGGNEDDGEKWNTDGEEMRNEDDGEKWNADGEEMRNEDDGEKWNEDGEDMGNVAESGVATLDAHNAARLFYLREDGQNIFDAATHGTFFGENPCILLGDDRDLTPGEEEIVLARKPVILSLGPRALHTNQCITIVHNLIDRLEKSDR